jgi:hypothetical protein
MCGIAGTPRSSASTGCGRLRSERRVPSLFFFSNLHPDYHIPRDDAKRINYPKLTRMARWMDMTGWIAANAAERPAVDSEFILR